MASRFGRGGASDALAVHRLLTSDRPDIAAADVVHERVLAAVGPLEQPRVIDAGCGLGGTIFYLQQRLGGSYDGLTLSPAQRRRAGQEAARRGLSRVCRFHLRSYDDDLDDLAPAGADLILAIESLAHAAAPLASVANLARVLRPGGWFVVVDDMPDEGLAPDDPDYAAFREGWSCAAVAGREAIGSALTSAGLRVTRDEDLTPRVIQRDDDARERLVRTNRRWRQVLGRTAAGALVDSLYGGLMLERLYRRGVIRYRLMAARRESSA